MAESGCCRFLEHTWIKGCAGGTWGWGARGGLAVLPLRLLSVTQMFWFDIPGDDCHDPAWGIPTELDLEREHLHGSLPFHRQISAFTPVLCVFIWVKRREKSWTWYRVWISCPFPVAWTYGKLLSSALRCSCVHHNLLCLCEILDIWRFQWSPTRMFDQLLQIAALASEKEIQGVQGTFSVKGNVFISVGVKWFE